MPLISPSDINAEFIQPLLKIAKSLKRNALKVRRAHREGALQTDAMPLNIKMAKRAVGTLEMFRIDVYKKTAGVLAGSLKNRENEKAKNRARYRAEKLAEHVKLAGGSEKPAKPAKRKSTEK